MGLFGGKNDSKARIEELKKKIQAEQAAISAEQVQPPATPPPAAPAPQAAAAPQPVYQQPPPMQPAPQQYTQQPQFYEQPQPQQRRKPIQVEELFEEEQPMDEIHTGLVLELGEGMSLNLPIKSRMRLDEFLRIADRVRELQRLAK